MVDSSTRPELRSAPAPRSDSPTKPRPRLICLPLVMEREGTDPRRFPRSFRCGRRGGNLLFLVAVVSLAFAPPARPADTLIDAGQNWRYLKGTTEASSPVDAWRAIDFDDRGWLIGRSGIGYGGDDDATVLPDMRGNYLSVFLRRTFSVS